jgi:subtilisin family serine protease
MDPLSQTRLHSLMNISSGSPDVPIGVIDGPVDLSHPAFSESRIKTVKHSQLSACKNASSIACTHGTFVTGILSAKRGLPAPAICPSSQIIIYPIFRESISNLTNDIPFPSSTAEDLSTAIIETINAGARIINLSLGLSSSSSMTVYDKLQEAYDYALQKDVIIVVAAGNQGNIGNISLINHQWLIPVAACDENARLDPISNFGPSIGNRGLMAPGMNVSSTYPGGQYIHMSGTSFAAPFVTGVIALLWSICPNITAATIIHSIRTGVSFNRHSVIPPLLNAELAYNVLKRNN